KQTSTALGLLSIFTSFLRIRSIRQGGQGTLTTALLPQDDCSEFRSQFEAGGRLSCTRENDPVRDSSGKQHINKCLMCAEKFREGNLQQQNRSFCL
uniref:Kazal-like domain-containing protein n=1 Tax=Strigops habroptila TaxID=2489341 RepID=A0A672U9C8_STRHB